jgi:hypothetical protein
MRPSRGACRRPPDLTAIGETQGGGNGQAGGCRQGIRGTLGEGEGKSDWGGRIDQELKGLDGGFRGALHVHIVHIRHHADVRGRILYLLQGALQIQGEEQGTEGIPWAHPTSG